MKMKSYEVFMVKTTFPNPKETEKIDMENKILHDVIAQFTLPEGEYTVAPYGNGHINVTYCVVKNPGEDQQSFIL